MNNSTQIVTASARIRHFFKALRLDRRGAEFVEVMVVIAVVALGGMAAMKAIQTQTKTGADRVGAGIQKIDTAGTNITLGNGK